YVAHLEEARDADPLVVRVELVAGHGEARLVPADADPRADPEREDRRLAFDAPLDRDHVLLVRRVEVVVVRDEPADNDVGAPAPRVLELLDGGGEERKRVDAGGLGGRVQLLDDPREVLERDGAVSIGELEVVAGDAAPDRVRNGLADRRTGLRVR